MRHYNPRKKQRFKLYFSLSILTAAILFVAFSARFEREAPVVTLKQAPFWNLTDPLAIKLSDNIGLKHYRIVLKTDGSETLLEEAFAEGKPVLDLGVRHPPARNLPEGQAQLLIQAQDTSLWRFFQGNKTQVAIDITLDRHTPTVNLIGHSYGIAPGGSAVVIFEARDKHLSDLHIVTKSGYRFSATPFYESGFYAALIARDVRDQDFSAHVLATDEAGNQTRVRIPLFLKQLRYRQSNITLSKAFLLGKIDDLHYQYDTQGRESNLSEIEKFLFVNEILRNANDELIRQYTAKTTQEQIDRFEIEPFAPLPSGAVVAHFGDRRDFYYNQKRVSHSYHLGIDLASVKEADVYSSNPGTVVYAGENGIYGNMPVIHHGLGLYSIYGHSTHLHAKEGDRVDDKKPIATTGVSGLALGDHLHFELRVQGVAVTPIEWMDRAWIKTNITNKIEESKKIIAGREG